MEKISTSKKTRRNNFIMALVAFVIAKIVPYLLVGILGEAISSFLEMSAIIYLIFGVITPKLKEESEKKYKYVALTVAFVIAGSAYIYLYKAVNDFVAVPRLLILSPLDKSVIEANSVHVTGIAEKDALIKINDKPVLVNDKGEFNENVILDKGVNEIKVKAVSKLNKESAQSIMVNANF